ncbi:hypothetical protein [Campylobacter sp.]|uniref:hypothetical protein n=1 Tax=Campylobacter sp. TaxID=205 RepID=UPI002AA7EBDA|nr:hypothetical protein [Campylobacter sp.]MCI6565166.1 hypothetical protein [Campylobacter sp.]
MPAIIAFVNWVVRILTLLWGKFFGVIAGFFVWLLPALRSFFGRRLSNARFFLPLLVCLLLRVLWFFSLSVL